MADAADLTTQERTACIGAGLRIESIDLHHKRALHFLTSRTPIHFPVQDTCRKDNGGIFSIPASVNGQPSGFIAFVPAAGAASRYHVSMVKLTGRDGPMVPKAILPAVQEGQTFLELKLREHRKIPGLVGQIFVAGRGQTSFFETALSTSQLPSDISVALLEQGTKFSTVRFSEAGQVIREEDHSPSIVPAGHGALSQLFYEAGQKFPKGHSFFIRNIDNVSGIKPEAIAATTKFLRFHQLVLELLVKTRVPLETGDLNSAASACRELFALVLPDMTLPEDPASILELALTAVFHTPKFLIDEIERKANSREAAIRELFQRPLNILGMVPNSGKDVGGTPVVARTPIGEIHLCMEVSHSSKSDHQNYLSNPAKATHFNPVFVASEVPKSEQVYQTEDHPFWTIAEKSYHNQKVVYHETLLYELIGNSVLSNCMFVEIPRILFNPHKTVEDALGRSISHWE